MTWFYTAASEYLYMTTKSAYTSKYIQSLSKMNSRYSVLLIVVYFSPTTSFTTKTTDTNKHNNCIIVALTMLTFATIAVFVAGILFYKCTYVLRYKYI